MEHFEAIVATLLEHDGYWVRHSFKINLTKEEKRAIGKPSMPRPEIDLLAMKHRDNLVLALEAKSYFDSPGVDISDLRESHNIPTGRYKLFTCLNYRNHVLARLKQDLLDAGMANSETRIVLGLVAGNVYQAWNEEIRMLFNESGWLFWSPDDVRNKVHDLAEKGYENNAAIITAKILMRTRGKAKRLKSASPEA